MSHLLRYIILVLLCIPAIGFAQDAESSALGINPGTIQTNSGSNSTRISSTSDGGSNETSSTHPLGLLPNPIIRKDTRYTYEDLIWRKIDTSLLSFHEYSLIDKFQYPHLYLGNVGQNYRSLVFDPNRIMGLSAGFDAYQKYWYTAENVKYYNTKVPYTSLYYNLGAGTENNANAIHSQNVSPYYNFAFDYKLTNSKGAFVNQKTLMNNLNINNWFNSKNHRYILFFAFLFNSLNTEENGGFNFDGLYEKENAGTDRALVPVNLNNAIHETKNRGVHLKQIYFLGKQDSVQVNDSTTINVVQRKHAISYSFTMDTWKHRYTDEQSDSDFYTGFNYDSTGTADSTRYWTTKHHLRFENTPETWLSDSVSTLSKMRYFVALEYTYTKYQNLDLLRKWNNVFLSGGIASNGLKDQKIHYGVNTKIGLNKDAIADYNINGFLKWKINDMMNLSAIVESEKSSPTQKETEYRSNHFLWENDFKPVFSNKISLVFRCDHGDIDGELTWHNVGQYIFFNEESALVQSNKSLNVLVFRASKAFNWKKFYLYNGITAQYIADESQLHLPKFIFKQSFHYQGGFFKGNVTANLGLDINYHTNYYADGYNPALSQFYYQASEKLNFYPVLDVFFEIKIKQTRLFFLMEHVNQGMFKPKGYYVAPNYGAQDRAFKLGVSWQFYD